MNGSQLAGRVALITGGASGMGMATANRLLAEGASAVEADMPEANGQAFLDDAGAMQAAGEGGSIINTASVAGLSGGAGPLVYSAAKAAVVNLTRAASVELAATGIRVNAICPGAILTPLAIGRADPERVATQM